MRLPPRTVMLLVAVLVGGGAGLYLLLSDDPAARYAYDTIDEPRARPFRAPRTDADRARDRAAGERLAGGLEQAGPSGALLTRAGLRDALARVRRSGDRLVSLAVTPARVDALVVGRDGRLRAVTVTPHGAEVVVQGPGPPASVPLPSVGDLDPATPGRLSGDATAVGATVAPTGGADPRWTVTLDDGRTVTGP